jgi:cytosine/adenosine deaminase-related metal-dependent hydrolase
MSEQPSPWNLTARWVFPVAGPPLERGGVTIRGDRITAVAPAGSRSADLDLGNAAILPGLVNAHTHLDLSGLHLPIPFTGDFTAWLRGVIAHRRGLLPNQVQDHVQAGLAESLAHGVTLVGDIAGGGLSWPVLAQAPLRAVVFYELLGLTAPRAAAAHAAAADWLASCSPTPTCRPGLSPHAPYSVRSDLFTTAASLARMHHLPLATHLAETLDELQLLQTGQGPFAQFLEQLGVWDPAGLVRDPAEVLARNDGVAPLLVIHGNYLDPALLRNRPAAVVYCPRTHAAFGLAEHPFPRLLAQGTCVALGTDSRASSPDLDLLAEARFLLQKHPETSPASVLRMATLNGAQALGWADETGSLEPGKSADLVVLALPDRDDRDPHRLLFDPEVRVHRLLFRGRWVLQALSQK